MEDNLKMKSKQQNRVITGLILVIAGAALLLRNVGFGIPGWLFSWPMILIAIGFFSGLKHNFRNRGSLVMMGIGGFFLASELLAFLHLGAFIWPTVIIGAGIYFMLRPEKTRWNEFGGNCKHRFDNVEEVKA